MDRSKVVLIFLFSFILISCTPVANQSKTSEGSNVTSGDGSSGGTGTGGNGGNNGGGTTTPPPPLAETEIFFNNSVEPMFQQECSSCHTEPRFGGTAPLSIFSYRLMKLKMANGPNSVNNDLIDQVTGANNHPGGNRCPLGVSQEPCKTIIDWYTLEFPQNAGGVVGSIRYISPTGQISGLAYDPSDMARKLTVTLYLDGPAGQGTLLGSVTADRPGIGTVTGHDYLFQLPAQYRNGVAHQLYVYADEVNADNQVSGSPRGFAAYTPTPEGQQYYANTVRPMIVNRCNGCHSVTYEAHYENLLTPTPFGGGTATTNELIVKMSGGDGHSGGNFCGGSRNNSPCAEVQTWWNLEFN